jgi:hypothetical protein
MPELNLDFAAFACLVESSGKNSNFHPDIEAIVSARTLIENANSL